VRLAKADDTAADDWSGDEDEAQEIIRLRTENAELRGKIGKAEAGSQLSAPTKK